MSRAPPVLASLKLGVGELGGFTGSGTRRLGPPALFPEPGATPPVPAGAAALGSFLRTRTGGSEEGPQRQDGQEGPGDRSGASKQGEGLADLTREGEAEGHRQERRALGTKKSYKVGMRTLRVLHVAEIH